MKRILLVFLVAGSAGSLSAKSPTGWSPVVVPTGTYRETIQSLPIQRRPGRPLHVYGNTVRLFEQARSGRRVRPLRQVLLGTDRWRSER